MVPIIVHRIEQHPMSVGVIEPSYIPEMLPGNSLCDNSNLLLPSVMIWHPLIQFPLSYHTLSICPNANCTGVLSFYVWPMGQNKGKQPRLIHDTKSIVLLVGAIYKCSNNHTVYSTDPRYLKKILPFVLLHRTGFTRTFIHSAISLAQEGLSMLAIARHICAVRKEYVSDRLLNVLYAYAGEQLTEEKIQSLAMSNNTTCLIHTKANQ